MFVSRAPRSSVRTVEVALPDICELLFQALTQSSKLTKAKGWNSPDATAKDRTTYQALFYDSRAKDYNNGNVRTAKEPMLV